MHVCASAPGEAGVRVRVKANPLSVELNRKKKDARAGDIKNSPEMCTNQRVFFFISHNSHHRAERRAETRSFAVNDCSPASPVSL